MKTSHIRTNKNLNLEVKAIMATTLVGIFDDFANAQKAVQELTQFGFNQSEISFIRNEPAGKGYTTYGGRNSTDYTTGTNIGDKAANFFDSIFGTDINDDERGLYSEAVRRGSTVLAVSADEAKVEQVADILNRNGAIDVDRRAAQYRSTGYQGFNERSSLYNNEQTQNELQTFANQGEIALPVIEEQLAVGKRVVQRGGVRVHTHITERPVEETVNLREEHVRVERTPVNRPATEADLSRVQSDEINITQHAEVPVVSKEARIVEEVVIGKSVEDEPKLCGIRFAEPTLKSMKLTLTSETAAAVLNNKFVFGNISATIIY
jgi:uncharacterized protein (TIGR02271 family)